MCGPSDQEKDISASQQKMYDTLSSNYSTTFGQQQDITSALTKMFTPILQRGPSQTGFSQSQENAMRTQASEGAATDYAKAQRATANILAARGGGNNLLPDSTSANLIATNADRAARANSDAQNSITQQNYERGYQNWQGAAGILGNTANVINPLGYAGQSTGAGQAASSTAQAMANQSNSIWNAAIGALGGVAGTALGNPSGLISGISKFGSGAQQMLSNPSPIISGFKSVQNLAPPTMFSGAGMSGGVPNFG